MKTIFNIPKHTHKMEKHKETYKLDKKPKRRGKTEAVYYKQ